MFHLLCERIVAEAEAHPDSGTEGNSLLAENRGDKGNELVASISQS
jgi:hypothetical protein